MKDEASAAIGLCNRVRLATWAALERVYVDSKAALAMAATTP